MTADASGLSPAQPDRAVSADGTSSSHAAAPPPSTRRGFFRRLFAVTLGSSLAVGFTTLVATHLLWLLGLVRFLFPNVLIEPPTKFKVGRPEDFEPGQVETKYAAQFGVWIVRYQYAGQPQIYALKTECTHLGCTPIWMENEQQFKCPCHGSGFSKEGINLAGPAPRPLERFAIRLAPDGQIEVDKSRKFQEELGQWKDREAFVESRESRDARREPGGGSRANG